MCCAAYVRTVQCMYSTMNACAVQRMYSTVYVLNSVYTVRYVYTVQCTYIVQCAYCTMCLYSTVCVPHCTLRVLLVVHVLYVYSNAGVMDCKFHPTQPWIFTAGSDSTVRLYT